MNPQYLEYCKKEIQEYLYKGLIRPSKSPWSCSAFYVLNAAELERGAPRLVINYKPLNKVLKWIRYPLPNKQDLIKRLTHSTIFSKFDMKSGYYQIGVREEDKYKTAFNVPFGHYEKNPKPWNPEMTEIIIKIKQIVKNLPCLGIPDPEASLIVETDASELGYGGILKQIISSSSIEYQSGIWHPAQQKYSTVKKEILSIVLYNHLDIIPIEPEWANLSKEQIVNIIFPENTHHQNYLKPRLFYEFILVDTESIDLFHSRDKEGNIIYSKAKILKIITPEEWGQRIYQPKTFSRQFQPQYYTYYDYTMAWTYMLFLKPKTHSWFFWFRRGISLKFPKWFLQWFYTWGPIRELFPKEVSENFDYFKEITTFLPNYKMITFVASQNITWIVTWDYIFRQPYDNVPLKVLARCIKVKWWNKFDLNLISKTRIKEWVNNTSPKQDNKTQISKDTQFLAEKRKIMAELASATSQEEFEERLRLVRSIQDEEAQEEIGSSKSESTNPYFCNEDMFYY
uniref:Polyprotein n=1 Tax=Cajanus cajan TaxID=3821 RepID=A0A151RL62_CAJCA|nr:polyprotein [Cajanus cajan]